MSPDNHTRIMLAQDATNSTYINASRIQVCSVACEISICIWVVLPFHAWIKGYKLSCIYIATQGPLSNSVNDFWKMIMEQQCKTIVMLCALMEEGEESCACYWPSKEETVNFGTISVHLLSVDNTSNGMIVRNFKLTETSVSFYQHIFKCTFKKFINSFPCRMSSMWPSIVTLSGHSMANQLIYQTWSHFWTLSINPWVHLRGMSLLSSASTFLYSAHHWIYTVLHTFPTVMGVVALDPSFVFTLSWNVSRVREWWTSFSSWRQCGLIVLAWSKMWYDASVLVESLDQLIIMTSWYRASTLIVMMS